MATMTTSIEPNPPAAADPATASTTGLVASRDGIPLLVRRWPAIGPGRATVLLVHGLAEHSGRYEGVGAQLAAAGLEVVAYDQRGFGGSGGRRADVERWSLSQDDLEDRLEDVRRTSNGRPVVLFGHSLGGLLALGYAVADPPRPLPDLLVLSAPALDSTVPRWKRILARALGSIAPTVSVRNDFDGSVLSRDPSVGAGYLADPLNRHATTVRFGAASFAEQARVRAALGRLTVPTLVYHGEDDRLVPAMASAPLAAVPGVVRRTYPNLRHESHNEPEGPAVIADVIDWLRARTTALAAGRR